MLQNIDIFFHCPVRSADIFLSSHVTVNGISNLAAVALDFSVFSLIICPMHPFGDSIATLAFNRASLFFFTFASFSFYFAIFLIQVAITVVAVVIPEEEKRLPSLVANCWTATFGPATLPPSLDIYMDTCTTMSRAALHRVLDPASSARFTWRILSSTKSSGAD